jgi:uncharacterized protein (TIGR02118 family)
LYLDDRATSFPDKEKSHGRSKGRRPVPCPPDVNAFERAYTQDHAPMVTAQNFKGITKFVAARVVGTPEGTPPPFYRIAELHFPSMQALEAATASSSAQQVVAHAVAISTGGKPVFLVADEETKSF